ncbi:MAG: serine protease, partial [Vicinamibacterales bacterium]
TVETGSLVLFNQLQESVIELWSPSAHASGFLVDAKGLIVTNQRSLGDAESIEVQIAPAIKVAGLVLNADRVRDVAIIWINPQVVASMTPLPVNCTPAARSIADDLFTIVTPLLARKDMTWGKESDLRIGPGSSGGPVFTREGELIGLTTDGESDQGARTAARIIPIHHSCDGIAAAEKKMTALTLPAATRLPVEPAPPTAATPAVVQVPRKPTDSGGTKVSSADFELAFLPPMRAADRRGLKGALLDFGNWTDYVLTAPPLLFIRAMPKLEEPLLMTLARGAAMTQGMAIPPIKRYKSSFLRMRAYCGGEEVSPIHPFTIEHPFNEKETVKEGFYVFDPDALGPQCASVKFLLYSEKAPDRADTRSIDPAWLK